MGDHTTTPGLLSFLLCAVAAGVVGCSPLADGAAESPGREPGGGAREDVDTVLVELGERGSVEVPRAVLVGEDRQVLACTVRIYMTWSEFFGEDIPPDEEMAGWLHCTAIDPPSGAGVHPAPEVVAGERVALMIGTEDVYAEYERDSIVLPTRFPEGATYVVVVPRNPPPIEILREEFAGFRTYLLMAAFPVEEEADGGRP